MLQQQEEIRQLKHDGKLLQQLNRRLLQKYGDALYTFEWTVQSLEKKEKANQDWKRKYTALDQSIVVLCNQKPAKRF